MDTLGEVIDECPYDTYPVLVEDSVNEELDDINQNDLIQENETEVNNEERE